MSTSSHSYDPADLTEEEIFWRDHYNYLKNRGYTLRKRYEPDWTPSWLNSSKLALDCEDSSPLFHWPIQDATRPDGSLVALKRIDIGQLQDDLPMLKLLSSKEFLHNPRNHCVPILEIIEPQEGTRTTFVVMPLLYDPELPAFETIGETIKEARFQRIREDVVFSYPQANFGLSNAYQPEDAPFLRQTPWGGDKSVPEFCALPGGELPLCDPFAVDVYCLGNYLRETFLDGRDRPEGFIRRHPQGFEFLRELIKDMINEVPFKRPRMSEVAFRFDAIVAKQSNFKLRSPVIMTGARHGFFDSVSHWSTQLLHMARRIPAIPKP
ncbi:hypothetical protein H0H93_006422 [Arthromyces matolae]|nr:hypothetical protein H0H93_006422 [Arthromyces matolae]